VCVDGQIRQDPGVDSSLDDPGYQMDDAWYVYVPVGADIKAVEDMGYFDADAMSQAASQGEPDSGTPYLIARDPGLYTDQQRRQYKHDVFPDLASVDMTTNVNPSIAFLGNHARYAVKPAPSAQSTYYLVENPTDPNNLASFPQIPDNQIENPSVPDSKSSYQQQADQAAAEEAARQQQEAAERQAALNAVAGDYRQFIVPHTLTAGDAMVGCYPMHTVKLNSDGTYTERSATCADYTTYSGSITSISAVDDHTYNLTLTPTATGESTMGTNPLPSLGNVQVWLAGRTVTEYPICTQEQMTNLDSYPSLECHTISEIVDDSGHLEKNAAIASDSISYQE
ncbi:hypothetical protein PSRA_1666, partial [Pseudoscardovia radai]